MTADGNSFTLSLPEATTDQWQAQFKLHTNLATSADKAYDFRVTFTSDQSIPGVTYKCVKSGGEIMTISSIWLTVWKCRLMMR